jgi:hypothetical protein
MIYIILVRYSSDHFCSFEGQLHAYHIQLTYPKAARQGTNNCNSQKAPKPSQQEPTSSAPVQYQYQLITTQRNLWDLSRRSFQERKNKRSELREGRRHSRRESGEREGTYTSHSISLHPTTTHAKSFFPGHRGPVTPWTLGTAILFLLFLFILQIRVRGSLRDSDTFKILLLNYNLSRFEREEGKEGAGPFGHTKFDARSLARFARSLFGDVGWCKVDMSCAMTGGIPR